jgi:hypothetical protein
MRAPEFDSCQLSRVDTLAADTDSAYVNKGAFTWFARG